MKYTVVVSVIAAVFGIFGVASAVDVECSDPGVPGQGTRQGPSRFTPGAKVSFDCPVGYERVGSPVTVCKDNGDWSLPLPWCVPDCPDIEAPANGAVSVSTARKYGSVGRFECDRGFSLVGAVAITCKDGLWNRPVPTCFADCAVADPPSNSQTRGGSSHGDVMYFRCLPGFQLVGQSMVTCKDGAWSDDFPRCLADAMM